MKASELRNKNVDELKNEMLALMKELFNLRIQKGAGQLAKSDRFKKIRVAIAQIKTVLTEKGSNV
jgi:large subunit ribosomal protein L29